MKDYMEITQSIFEGALRAKEKGIRINLETYFDSNLRKTDFKIVEKKPLFAAKKTLFVMTDDYAKQVANRREIGLSYDALSVYISYAKEFGKDSVYNNVKDATLLYDVVNQIESVYTSFKDTLNFDEQTEKFVEILEKKLTYTVDHFTEEKKVINVTVKNLTEKQIEFINNLKLTINAIKNQETQKEQTPTL